jgi:hypothetical protein
MVVREVDQKPFHIKVDGKWVFVDEEVLRAHPGASAITTYRNSEASTVFHTFHGGSKWAYKWLAELKEKTDQNVEIKIKKGTTNPWPRRHQHVRIPHVKRKRKRADEKVRSAETRGPQERTHGLGPSLLFPKDPRDRFYHSGGFLSPISRILYRVGDFYGSCLATTRLVDP